MNWAEKPNANLRNELCRILKNSIAYDILKIHRIPSCKMNQILSIFFYVEQTIETAFITLILKKLINLRWKKLINLR